jgi:hypothetical protein
MNIPILEAACEVKGDCNGWNMGYLILSLGITLILVGALFYYVKQRIEVLETSQKEQIHIMQSFIASIGDQFQRMNMYIQTKLGVSSSTSGNSIPMPQPHTSTSKLVDSRIDISESSDSNSDSDSDSDPDSDSSETSSTSTRDSSSASSNTTRDSYQNEDNVKQIKIHDLIPVTDIGSPEVHLNVHSSSSSNMENIKVIELSDPLPESDIETDSASETDSETESSSDSEYGVDPPLPLHTVNDSVHVTKLESVNIDNMNGTNSANGNGMNGNGTNGNDNDNDNDSSGKIYAGNQKKTLIIDLDENENKTDEPQYSTLSIKQLRQLLKKKSPLLTTNDISKMKRESIIELLEQ